MSRVRVIPLHLVLAGLRRACGRDALGVGLLLAVCFVAVVGWTLHPRLLLLLPAMGLLVALGWVWPWLTIRLVRGELRFGRDRIFAGERVQVALRVAYRGPWPAWGLELVVDPENRLLLPKLRPFTTSVTSFSVQAEQRGVFPRWPPTLQSGFPVGLVRAARRVSAAAPLVVWPRVFPAAPVPDWARSEGAAGHVETRRVGTFAGDTVGVREYRRGDPMRWIHWPQTARHARFMVREFRANGIPRVRIVLDCDADAHVGAGAQGSFEWAVRIAASLAARWLDDGAEVELTAGALRLPPAAGQAHRRRVLDALAEADLVPADRCAPPPPSELATVFVSTDLGWSERREPACRAWRGFLLRSGGFGGVPRPLPRLGRDVIVIERPENVPAALARLRGGLADVA